jgi:tetratricopeptide (TPR) repeat protein
MRWFQHILALDATNPLPDALRPQFFHALGVLGHTCGRFDEAAAYHTEALRLWTTADDQAGIARANIDIAQLYHDAMRLDEALLYAEEGLARAERVGAERLLADALMARSIVVLEGPRLEGVVPDLERSLAIWRKVEDLESQALNLALLGGAYQRSGDYERSKPFIAESVRLRVRMGAYGDLISALMALHFQSAFTAESQEQALDAARVVGVIILWQEHLYRPPSPYWESEQARSMRARIVEKIGSAAMERGIAEGQRMRPPTCSR